MGKRKKNRGSPMREWPEDDTCGVPYNDLILPLRKIIQEGYRLERLPTNNFNYTGYNIGKQEREIYNPTPEERFSSRWLDNEKKMKRTLLDNILVTVFQLGMEQGRRLDRTQGCSNELLHDILAARTKTVKDLRARLALYDPTFDEGTPIPLEMEGDDLMIEDVESELSNVDV